MPPAARRRASPRPSRRSTRRPRPPTCAPPTPCSPAHRTPSARPRRSPRRTGPTAATLRRARARDRRPAALDARRARDLRAADRALRRAHADAAEVLADDPDALRVAAGLVPRKGRYLRSLAEHVLDGSLDLEASTRCPTRGDRRADGGQGHRPWSAQMYLMFHLERPDVLAVGDLGIRKARDAPTGCRRSPTRPRWSGSPSRGGRTARSRAGSCGDR